MNNEIIYLPVSLGEAIDKLTILDIKLNNIKDERKIDVKIEYDLLYDKLKCFLDKYNDLYISMKKINLIIWNQMDSIRDINIKDDKYIKLCKECIEMNDIRFRIKNKINFISNSILKEQKGYKINKLLIKINNEIDNIIDFIQPIKYYSFIYDEIFIYSNNKKLSKQLSKEFLYDPTINFKENIDNIDNKKIIDNDILFKEYKKFYLFTENNYEKENIYKIFELNEDIIKNLL